MEYHHAYDAHAMPHVTNPPHLEDFEQAALETLLMPPPPPLASRGGRDASFSPDVGLGGERAGAARDAYALASTSGGRPPLREMDDPRETFEREFKEMHVANGVNFDKLAHTLNRRLQRTNKPFDTYGLYRAVTNRGGFVERPTARKNLSMVEVFREMSNHYDGHTYTDIGTLLLNTYEKYFLEYERAHPQDLAPRPAPATAARGDASNAAEKAEKGAGGSAKPSAAAKKAAAAAAAAGGANGGHAATAATTAAAKKRARNPTKSNPTTTTTTTHWTDHAMRWGGSPPPSNYDALVAPMPPPQRYETQAIDDDDMDVEDGGDLSASPVERLLRRAVEDAYAVSSAADDDALLLRAHIERAMRQGDAATLAMSMKTPVDHADRVNLHADGDGDGARGDVGSGFRARMRRLGLDGAAGGATPSSALGGDSSPEPSPTTFGSGGLMVSGPGWLPSSAEAVPYAASSGGGGGADGRRSPDGRRAPLRDLNPTGVYRSSSLAKVDSLGDFDANLWADAGSAGGGGGGVNGGGGSGAMSGVNTPGGMTSTENLSDLFRVADRESEELFM